jgi:uncharacterized protein (TIGR00661 family)
MTQPMGTSSASYAFMASRIAMRIYFSSISGVTSSKAPLLGARYVYFAALFRAMQSQSSHRILVAPLDWGLGHATRCVPLIDRWLEAGHEVVLASNGRSAAWLAARYPQLELLTDIPDYAVTYPTHGPITPHLVKQLLRLRRVVRAEHRWLERIVEEKNIHQVCSDNRYGLYHDRVPCTLITHQLYLRVPGPFRWIVGKWLNAYLKRFRALWVPDYERGSNLSGLLSHGGMWDKKALFIGPLSRFHSTIKTDEKSYRVVAIVSGPEPTRTRFENQLRNVLPQLECTALLVLGKPEEPTQEQNGMVHIVNDLPDSKLAAALKGAQLVVCRSGYSTLMDLHNLDVQALLVPTPGQSEQQYLAKHHAQQGTHHRLDRHKLNLTTLKAALKQ